MSVQLRAAAALHFEDHGPVQTGTIRRSGRLLHAGSHRTAGSLLMPVRITRKDYKEELHGIATRKDYKEGLQGLQARIQTVL